MSTRLSAPREPGYDVARAIALFGMVLVNFRGVLDAYDHGTPAVLSPKPGKSTTKTRRPAASAAYSAAFAM